MREALLQLEEGVEGQEDAGSTDTLLLTRLLEERRKEKESLTKRLAESQEELGRQEEELQALHKEIEEELPDFSSIATTIEETTATLATK